MKKLFTFLLAILAMAGTARAEVEWTIWEGTFSTSNSANGWDNALALEIVNFTDLETGDVVYVYASEDTGTHEGAQQFYSFNNYQQGRTENGQSAEWYWTDAAHISGGSEAGNFSFTVTDDILSELNASTVKQLLIRGKNYSISKVAIKKKTSMIKTSLWTGTHNFNNWNGLGIEATETGLKALADNDFVYAKATRHTESYEKSGATYTPDSWQAQLQDWSGDDVTDKYSNIGVNGFNHDFWFKIADASKVGQHKMGVSGENYDLTEVCIYHPVSSFSIGSIGLATFCAGVAVSVPSGIEAYTVAVNDAKTAVVLTKIESGVIPASTGVIIKGDEGSVVEFAATTTEGSATSALTGVTTGTSLSEGDYILYNNGGTAEFRKASAGSTLAANKAYLPASSISSNARLAIVFADESAGIAPVQAKHQDSPLYNLNGLQVKTAKSGLYVRNGKKYIVK